MREVLTMWDKEFDTETYVYGKEPNEFLKEHYEELPKGKVLCLAEGEGRNAVFLATKGFDVTAVDISQVGLNKAKKLAKEAGVEIRTICKDLAAFDLGEQQWDSIVSISCHLPLVAFSSKLINDSTTINKGKKISEAASDNSEKLAEFYIKIMSNAIPFNYSPNKSYKTSITIS